MSIWSARALRENGYGWRIGTRHKVNIWNDPWLPKPRDVRIRNCPINIVYTTVSDLIDPYSATWKVDTLFDIFDEVQARKICSIPLSKAGHSDVVNWRPDGSGIYFVKSGYRLLCNDMNSSSGIAHPSHVSLLSRFYNEMWVVRVPSMIPIIMWRIINNFVPTYANLQSQRLSMINVFPFCLISSETVEHIMKDCWFVQDLFHRQYVHLPFSLAAKEWND
ncbi:hypothetical protein V6N13_071339 [Hibiscus sabdariffa]